MSISSRIDKKMDKTVYCDIPLEFFFKQKNSKAPQGQGTAFLGKENIKLCILWVYKGYSKSYFIF